MKLLLAFIVGFLLCSLIPVSEEIYLEDAVKAQHNISYKIVPLKHHLSRLKAAITQKRTN